MTNNPAIAIEYDNSIEQKSYSDRLRNAFKKVADNITNVMDGVSETIGQAFNDAAFVINRAGKGAVAGAVNGPVKEAAVVGAFVGAGLVVAGGALREGRKAVQQLKTLKPVEP